MSICTINQLAITTVSKDLGEWFVDWLNGSKTYGKDFLKIVSGWNIKDNQWTSILDQLGGDDWELFINIYFMVNYRRWGYGSYESLYDWIEDAWEAIVKICTEVGFEERQNPFYGFFKIFGSTSGIYFTFKNIVDLNNAVSDNTVPWMFLSGLKGKNNEWSILFNEDLYSKNNLGDYLEEWGSCCEGRRYYDSEWSVNLNLGASEEEYGELLKNSGILSTNVDLGDGLYSSGKGYSLKENFFKTALFTGKWEKSAWGDKLWLKDLSTIQADKYEYIKACSKYELENSDGDTNKNKSYNRLNRMTKKEAAKASDMGKKLSGILKTKEDRQAALDWILLKSDDLGERINH